MHLLPDKEVMDFVAGGSLRAFAELCSRKAPWLAVYAAGLGGGRDYSRARAGAALLEMWKTAPLSPMDDVDAVLTNFLRRGSGEWRGMWDAPADMAGFVDFVAQRAVHVAQQEPAPVWGANVARKLRQMFKSAPSSGSGALVGS